MFLLGLCLGLRLLRLNNPLNIYSIKAFIETNTHYLQMLPISIFIKGLMIVNFLLILCIIFLIIRRVHKYYIAELIKLHLYYVENSRLKGPEYSFLANKSVYAQFAYNFELKWSFIHFTYNIGMIITKITLFLCYFYPFLKGYTLKYLSTILLLIPHIILFCCFIYDCMFNEGFLKYTLLCLIFYTIFFIWVRYTYFLHRHYPQYNAILFEWYYGQPRVMYLEMNPHDIYELKVYIKNGLSSKNSILTMYELMDIHPIQIHNRFEQLPDHKFLYLNPNSRLGFLKSNVFFTTHYCVKKYETAFLEKHQKKEFKKTLFLYLFLIYVVTTFGNEVSKVSTLILSKEQKLQFLKGFFYYTKLISKEGLTELSFVKRTCQFLTTPILPNPDLQLNFRIVSLAFPKYLQQRNIYIQ